MSDGERQSAEAAPAWCGYPDGYLDYAVRLLRPGDERPLAEFYANLSERSRYFFEPYTDTSVEAMREVVARSVSGADLSLAALEPGGRVIGHVFYREVDAEVPHLGIGLLDAYQDLGLGSTLLAYLISLGRHVLGKRAIGLTVMKENARARHLYEKFGFRVLRDVTFRTTDDSHEMRLEFACRPADSRPETRTLP